MAFPHERRKRLRTEVHWPVRLFRSHDHLLIESTTKDISSNGFYCLSKEPFTPGELLECTILIPAQKPGNPKEVLYLECRSRVVRVERTDVDGTFGVGCRIEDYCIGRLRPKSS